MSAIDYPDPGQIVLDAIVGSLLPPRRLSVSEWADLYRRLPTKGASESGRWRTSRVPFAREIMDCLSPLHPARRIVFMKSTQVGATEIGNNWLGLAIGELRAPVMVVQPTIDLAKRWSKQRLQAMIESTPVLRDKILPAKSRDASNTILLKEWPGGLLIISGANSSSSLRSMPARYLFADEVDAYPIDLEGEGDPLSLAEARTSTFQDRKVFLCSTPTIESLSVINREYQASDQRHYHVPCPHCHEMQPLEWEQLHWPEDEPHKALYCCTECGKDVEEWQKTKMLECGRWVATHPEREVRGYHVHSLYTPIGLGLSWGELAATFERVKRDPIKLKAFTNTKLGECTEDPEEKLDMDELKHRAGDYERGTIPDGCLILTAGVDVQGGRWAILILGFGQGDQEYIIDYTEIEGDPTKEEEWLVVDDYLFLQRFNSTVVPFRPAGTGVDSGYLQDDVLNYCRTRQSRQVWAMKGSSTRRKSIIGVPSKVEVSHRGRLITGGALQWQVGGDAAKERIFLRLQADKDKPEEERLIHFPRDLDESFYSQLSAEIFDPNKRRWVKTRPRNEAIDCYVYATAAARHARLQLHRRSREWWSKLAETVGAKAEHEPKPAEPTRAIQKAMPKPARPGGGRRTI